MNPYYYGFFGCTFFWAYCEVVIQTIAKMQALQARATHHKHLARKPQAPKPVRHQTYNWH